jgi:diadenosine tetraphosphate (Ap4A) HIT family hydrolase
MDSVFTKIYNGEIPGEIVYDDDQCFVMLTIEPITPGHCLVIPKEQIDHLWDTNDELYRHLMDVAKIMAERMRTAYDYKRIGMLVEGFGVPHAHVHIFGYEQPLEPTMMDHIKNKRTLEADELKMEAGKLRA